MTVKNSKMRVRRLTALNLVVIVMAVIDAVTQHAEWHTFLTVLTLIEPWLTLTSRCCMCKENNWD